MGSWKKKAFLVFCALCLVLVGQTLLSAQSPVLERQIVTLADDAAANATATFTFNSGNGITGGALYFTFSAGGYAGATIAVDAGPDLNHLVAVMAATALAAVATTQRFAVDAIPAGVVRVTYTTAGATAVTYDLTYSGAAGGGAIGAVTILNEPIQVEGSVADGAAAGAQPPVAVAGVDGAGNVQRILTSSSGALGIGTTFTPAHGTANQGVSPNLVSSSFGSLPYIFNGTLWDLQQSADLSTLPTSVTLVARNSIGAALAEKGSRWSVFSSPGAGTIGSASIALEASVRHVADCISFSASSTTAPALTGVTVELRDGATGAGTVIWQYRVVFTAAAVQHIAHSVCGLNLVGTTGTAMTLEFSVGVANVFQSASISGYNVN